MCSLERVGVLNQKCVLLRVLRWPLDLRSLEGGKAEGLRAPLISDPVEMADKERSEKVR
jgi:hypothetical protein